MGRIGMPELIVILLIFVLLFGARKLPELAKGLAQAMNIFKKEAREIKESLEEEPADQNEKVSEATYKEALNDYDPEKSKRDWRPNTDTSNDKDVS